MMRSERVAPIILLQKLGFGVLILLIAGLIGIESIEAASNPQNDGGQFSENSALISEIPAFPGAEGFGTTTPGGRGGQVIEVTNLDDSGSGSLRAAIEADGPRIVVFRVGGTIELQSSLNIIHPYITIAGQTAPGGGIALKNVPSNNRSTLIVSTHDVIIRYLRVRPGPSTELADTLDAIKMPGAYNVIIDHSSFSWATDENVDAWYDAHDITIQWSIISEGLNNSTHLDGPHSMGMLLGSEGSGNMSVHHNLFAHNKGRNPRMNAGGVVDVVNNIIYNPGDHPSTLRNDWHPFPPVNYVGNLYKMGANSNRDYLINTEGSPAEIFVQGNITPNRPTNDLDEVEFVVEQGSMEFVVSTMHPVVPVTTLSAFEAYDQVLANAGATLPLRDVVDERVVNDVANGTGAIIDDPSQVGGWPELDAGTPPLDSDHDGMPDEWENQYGFDPNNPADGNADADGDGYTNIEEHLNSTEPILNEAPTTIPPGIKPPTPTPTPTDESTPEIPTDSISLGVDGPASVISGETFSASVMAGNVTGDGLYGVQLELNYDPALISASNLQVNPNLSFVVINSADNTTGKIQLVASQQGDVPGLTGDVTLLTFDATAVGSSGTATFSFENEKFSDPQAQNLAVISQGYTVSIEETVTPEPTLEPTQEPTPEPTLEPTQEPTPEPTLEPTQEPTPEPTQEPTPEPTLEPTQEPTPEPTQEPTPEPTQEPTVGIIFGQVILAGRAGNDWSNAIVVIDDNGQNSNTDTNGDFTIASVAYGVYNSLTVDASGYLPAVCSQATVQSVETALATIALISGDINDDNLVDIVDATTVGASFGQTGPDLIADINRDQILDIFDIVLVSTNFGIEGPTPWNCMAN